MKTNNKNQNQIGQDVKIPQTECDDKNCPFHGTLKVHGRQIVGTVTSDKMKKTVLVSWERRIYVPKFERYEKKMSKVKAHSSPCLNIKTGDTVRIMSCRPLSKTTNFVVIEKIEE